MSKYLYKNQFDDLEDSKHFISDCFKPRGEWLPDYMAKECKNCQTRFDLFTRRHHCRMCGNVFDYKCSNQFVGAPIFSYMDETKIRLCRACYEKSLVLAKKIEGQSLKGKIGLKRLSSDQIGILEFNVNHGLEVKWEQTLYNSLNFLIEEHGLDKKWFENLKEHVRDALTLVNPCCLQGDDIDINRYIKIKKILYKDDSLTTLVKGEVIRRNVALKKMPKEIGLPKILMIKGSIELTKHDELCFMDTMSIAKEQEHLEHAVNRMISKLGPHIIITEGSVHRIVQDMLQQAGISLIMKLKTHQFDRLCSLTKAKPIEEFDKIDNIASRKLGNCIKFRVKNYENKPFYEHCERFKTNKVLWDNFDPSLMYFEGCQSERGATILVSGPDESELIKVKAMLKKLLQMIRNNLIEKSIIYDDYQIYHSRERLFEKLNDVQDIADINNDFRENLTIEVYLAEDLENLDQGVHVTCLLNPTTCASIGFLTSFMTERYTIKEAFEKTKIVFTKTVSVPIDFTQHEFSTLNSSTKQKMKESLSKSKRFNTKDLCQIGSDPKKMAVKFYSNEDITLGEYLRYKWSRVLDICPESKRYHYYNTSFFFYDRFYCKVTLELKEGQRLQFLKREIKKDNTINKEEEQVETISSEDTFYDFQTVLHNLDKFKTPLSQFPKEIIMYVECSKCGSRLSESTKISQVYLNYSFSRFIQFICNTAGKYIDLLQNCQKNPDGFINKCMETLQKLEMLPNIRECCSLSPKTRVFNVDDLFIKFNVGRADCYKIDLLDFTNEKTAALMKASNDKLIMMKRNKLAELERGYMAMLIGSMKDLVQTLIEKSKLNVSIETIDKLESILNVNNPLSKDPYNKLLLGIVPVYKDFLNLKFVSEKTLAIDPENHLEIDLWRKKFFDRIQELYDIFDYKREEFIKSMEASRSSGSLKDNSLSRSNTAIGFELGEMKANNFNNLQTLKSSVYDEHFELDNEIEVENTPDDDDETDKETYFIDHLALGFYKAYEPGDSDPNQKFKALPLFEDQTLSVIAFSLNSASYMKEVYGPEGFLDIEKMVINKPKEERYSEAFLKIIEKKLIIPEGKIVKPFIFKIPSLDNKPKGLNFAINSISDEYGEPVVKRKRKKTVNFNMITDIAGIIDLGHMNRSMSTSTSMSTSGRFNTEKSLQGKYSIIFHYPTQFEALRQCYNFDLASFISSVSTTNIWQDVAGGKTKAKFEKTNDERLIFKEIEKKNFQFLLGFMPEYFKYMHEIMNKKKPSVLAKVFGLFEVQTEKKTEYKIVMENLFYGLKTNESLIYDLKGSVSNRYLNPTDNKVLLDTNYRIDRNGEPLPLDSVYYDFLETALKNDTEFLTKAKVMDYSLLLIIDEINNSIRVGIIDITEEFDIRRLVEHNYKKFVKKAMPTVAHPDLYKERFLAAMKRYFMPIYREGQKAKIQ